MKNKNLIGLALILAMVVSFVCPVFAASTSISLDSKNNEYTWGDKIVLTVSADTAKMFIVTRDKDDKIVLIDSVDYKSKGKYTYTIKLPSAANDTWALGDYTINIDGTSESFEIVKKSTTTNTNKGGGGGGGGGGIIISNTTPSNTTGVISAIMNPNQYGKFGTDASAVSVVGTKLSNDTFSVKASINGTPQIFFDGYDPIMVKVPYISGATNPWNLVVLDQNGKVVPRSLYMNGYMYVAPKDLSGIFTIVEINKSFDDVYVDWPKEAISALAARNIINGVGDNLFDPDNYVTRAQFIKMITAAFDVMDNSAVCTFWDVPATEWYAPYVATAQKLGITLGYEDGSFNPDATITREEMCAMLYRAADILSVQLPTRAEQTIFSDDANIADYAKTGIYAMQKAGIINGVGNNTFDAKGLSTRAQAAVAIYNMFRVSMNFGF